MAEESNQDLLEPIALEDLFRKAKDKIGEEELRPLRDYKEGSLEQEFDKNLIDRLDRLLKKWLRARSDLRKTIRSDKKKKSLDTVLSVIFGIFSTLALISISGVLGIDAAARIVFSVLTVLTFLLALYGHGSHRRKRVQLRIDKNEGVIRNAMREIEDNAKNCARLELAKLKTQYDLNEWPWRMRVPQYTGDNPCKFLVERHDDYSTTGEFRLAKQYIETHDRGSIGVAGERGAGKTAMMRQLRRSLDPHAEQENEGFKPEDQGDEHRIHTVWMSAPTIVEEKEFLISVLAKLVTSVGVKLTGNNDWPNDPPGMRYKSETSRRRRNKWAARLIFGSFAMFVLRLFLEFVAGVDWIPQFDSYRLMALIILIAVGVWIWPLIRSAGPRDLKAKSRKIKAFIVVSTDLLEELWYERKDILSSKFSLSQFGASASVSSGREKKREPFTLPHLVDMWDKYIGHLTRKNGGLFRKVVVFIDEIDKLKAPDKIAECMLILKALYNPPNLLFVVSVSEDAYKQFEKRPSSLESRNEFDSSVDHSVWVEKIKCDELRVMINKRMLGYPFSIPVIQLIWMLSKGNPRDAIRLARSIPKHDEGRWLEDIAAELFPRLLGTTVDTYRRVLAVSDRNCPALNDLCVREVSPSGELDKNITGAITEVMRLMSRGSVRKDERMSYSMLLAELDYSRIVCKQFYSNPDLSRCIVLYKCNPCRRAMEEVQNHLSKRNPERVLQLLGDYCTYQRKVGAIQLNSNELQDAISSLLVDADNGLTLKSIHEQLNVHAKEKQTGDALDTLKKGGFAKCSGDGPAARWTLANEMDLRGTS